MPIVNDSSPKKKSPVSKKKRPERVVSKAKQKTANKPIKKARSKFPVAEVAKEIVKLNSEEAKVDWEDEPDEGRPMTPKQKDFAKYYATHGDCFGNGKQAYMKAYECDPLCAEAWASRLLRNVKVCVAINDHLEKEGLNDQYVDKQLLFIISQHADMGNKMRAIDQYNKLKGRLKQQMEVLVNPNEPFIRKILANPKD
jgi:hypothetical protein